MDNPFVAPIVEGVLSVVEPAFRKSGVGEISGVGMSSLAIEENLWRSKMFVHHQPSKGSGLIWDMFGEQPHTLEVLSLAPDNTVALMHSDLDVKRVIDWADTVFGEMLGGESIMANAPPEVQDILDSFGNEAGFLMTLDAENKMTLPGFMFDRQDDLELDGVAFALLLRVNDDTLMEMLGEAMGGGFGAPEGTKVGDVTIHSVPLPIPLPIKMDLSPCYFQVGNYMVLSSAESLAKRMAEAHDGKGRLADDDDFKALTKGLSLEANGIYYADPQATEWGIEINELSLGKLDGRLGQSLRDLRGKPEARNRHGLALQGGKGRAADRGQFDRQPVRRQYRALDRRSGRRRGLVAQRPAAVRPVRGSRRLRPAGLRRRTRDLPRVNSTG